jgi:putative acetyltransferase
MISIRQAAFGGESEDVDVCRRLMREYAVHLNASVGGEHICLQSFEEELAALPGPYAPPEGGVLLAFDGEDDPAGCVALKPLKPIQSAHAGERACEMKRLWVRPAQQGKGLGRQLADACIDLARTRGYTAMYLDTMPASMQAAFRIYAGMGFTPVERYTRNPVILQPESIEIAYLRREL